MKNKKRFLLTALAIASLSISSLTLSACSTNSGDTNSQPFGVMNNFFSLLSGNDGKDGIDGKDGKDGIDGKDGKDGVGIANITIDEKGQFVFTLTDDRVVYVPLPTDGAYIHIHQYSCEWTFDETDHWHASVCKDSPYVLEKAAHEWDEGVITKEASTEEEGSILYSCTVCAATKTETIAKLPATEIPEEPIEHNHDMQKVVAVDSTCLKEGNIEYYVCTSCDKIYSDAEGVNEIELSETVIPVKAHDHSSVNIVTKPTATETGAANLTCKTCSDVITVTLPVLNSPEYTISNSATTTTYTYIAENGQKIAFSIMKQTGATETYPVRLYNYVFDYESTPEKTVGVKITVYTLDEKGEMVIVKQSTTSHSRQDVLDETGNPIGYLDFGVTSFSLPKNVTYYVTILDEDMPEGCAMIDDGKILEKSTNDISYTVYLGQPTDGTKYNAHIIKSGSSITKSVVAEIDFWTDEVIGYAVYFDFTPTQEGTYKINAVANNGETVTISSYFITGFISGEPVQNELTKNVTGDSLGNTYKFGFTTDNATSVTVTITKVDD